MKLIIREYLSLLKEDGEFDKVLQDLLLMMNIRPISKPQRGVRQNGVDIAAVKYSDPPPTLYLFVIKCGDIGRSDWGGNSPQSIRPSLDEIKDTYLLNNIQSEHKDYLKKVVVCTGGVFKQEIEQQYIGYAKTNGKQGVIEYEFWDGNKLAEQIMKYMLNETILVGEYQSPLRKMLALLGDPDYDLSDYYNILKSNFIEAKYDKNKSQKTLRTINLILSIIFYWAKNADNLKPALYCAERTMLYLWEFMRRNESLNDKNALALLMQVYETCVAIYNSYVVKFKDACTIKDGLHGHSRYSILESINIFEQLGIFSLYGLMTMASVNGECRELKEKLKIFIENHKSLLSPTFDNHIIDISLAAIFLTKHSEHGFLDNWISEMVSYIAYAFLNLGLYFPIVSDSIEDFVSLESGATPKKN
jgi:hypothetical protein